MKRNYTELYSNINIFDACRMDDIRENIAEENGLEFFEVTDEEVVNSINNTDTEDWEYIQDEMENFFNDEGGVYILSGHEDLWYGNIASGIIFKSTEFSDILEKICRNIDYLKIYDEGGKFFIEGIHHDGRNFYEIRKLTEKGEAYYDNWEYNWNDKRTEKEVHTNIMKYYSNNLHYAKKVYGNKEFIKENKQEEDSLENVEVA